MALVLSSGTFSRNVLALRWYDLVSQYANGQIESAAALTQAEHLNDELAAACASAPAVRSARICMFSDMASVIAGELDAAGLQARLDSYPPASLEQATLAGFGGEYYYARATGGDTALALWSRYLPEGMLIYRAQMAATNDDWETAAALVAALPDNAYEGDQRLLLAQLLVELAGRAFAEQNFVSAEAYWRRAIKQWPDRPSYYVSLSRALSGQQRWQESALVLEEAIRLRPQTPQYYAFKAQALLRDGQFAEAAAAAQIALQLDPDNALASELLAAARDHEK